MEGIGKKMKFTAWEFFFQQILDIFGFILDNLGGLLDIFIQILAHFQIILPLWANYNDFFTAFVSRILINASGAQ